MHALGQRMLGLIAAQFQHHAVVQLELPGLACRQVYRHRPASAGGQTFAELAVAFQHAGCRTLGADKHRQRFAAGGEEHFAALIDQARLAFQRRPARRGAMLFERQFYAVRPDAAQRRRAHPGHALEGVARGFQIHREEVPGQRIARRMFDLRARDMIQRRRHQQLLQRQHRQALQGHGRGPGQQDAAGQQQHIGQQVDQHRPIPEAVAAALIARTSIGTGANPSHTAPPRAGRAPVAGRKCRPHAPPSAPANDRSCRARCWLPGNRCAPRRRA